MKKFIIISFYLIFISGSVIAENIESSANNLFHIGQMNSHNKNFEFDISNKKLNQYPLNGRFDFIISSFAKNCSHSSLKENYKCSYYKPLISNNLIN